MAAGRSKRISGTYWERCLVVALPFPAICLIPLIISSGPTLLQSSVWEGPVFLIFLALLIWIADLEPISRQKPVPLYVNGVIEIGSDLVKPEEVTAIVPLRRYKQITVGVFEVRYTVHGESRSARIMSKPDVPVLGFFHSYPRSIRSLLKHFPALAERLMPEERI
jgi:hypothetical protein